MREWRRCGGADWGASPVHAVLLQQLLLRLLGAAQLRQGLDHGAAARLFVGIIQGLVMQSMVSGDSHAMKSQSGPVFTIYLQGICP